MPVPARILIVEDEDILARNLQSFFARMTPEVRVAADARSTMEILESFTPDIILLDFDLPGINGVDIYAAILRRSAPQAGCVMITGHLSSSIARAAREEGISHVLCKPFSFAELQEVIDHLSVKPASVTAVFQDAKTAAPQPPGEGILSDKKMGTENRHYRERRALMERRRSMH